MSQERGWSEDQMCHRVLQDLWEGSYVNLGVGIPIGITKYLSAESGVILHSENGLLGMGNPPAQELNDPDIINAVMSRRIKGSSIGAISSGTITQRSIQCRHSSPVFTKIAIRSAGSSSRIQLVRRS